MAETDGHLGAILVDRVDGMRAYSGLCSATSPVEAICPSSHLYYEPFTAVIHDAEVIIKPRVDLYSVFVSQRSAET